MRKDLEIVSVNYNTPDLIENLIESINNIEGEYPIRIMDGSDKEPFISQVKDICDRYDNVILEQFGWNMHHGRSADLAVSSTTYNYVLLIDSDATILEPIINDLTFNNSFEGFGCQVNSNGIDVKGNDILYLHPSFLLINSKDYKGSDYKFIHHGAPAIQIMKNIGNEFKEVIPQPLKKKFNYGGRGTVNRFGYNFK